ncbi:hypothetical protein M0R89_06525 [Halorussus limi]|uniref:Sjogren's syndrome/scleroderma autoantigen 1 (Autoantigen p27) n=1 Tax=Halorussus limi TaxID=2938695 RepID=A0A8U0HX58_9EURY|nr:Sjogren's syndrome/scleroderma autoantigen 1 family protein [Halorussus limi]UPV75715.1 hypothetical protein M0R89_06525 [Halorussus limi]
MSSDDSEFDKEAEREKLREKYGDEDEDRENTRRMSELLLQGATMTGKHCDNCGDPIFRYDGQEFCPTCQHEAQQAQQADADAGRPGGATGAADTADATRTADTADTAETTDSGDRAASDADAASADAGDERRTADQQADGEPRVEINDVRVSDRHADPSKVRRPPSQTQNRDRAETGNRDRARNRTSSRESERAHDHRHARGATDRDASARGDTPVRTPTSEDARDLTPAREALVRKLSDLARRAEETDDVTRARELLAATREAAEALAALDRANR